MKISTYACLFLGLTLFSCEDKINLVPDSQFTSANFYRTEKDLEQAVVGAYDALQHIGQYGQYFVYFMEVASDNSVQESTTNSGGVFAAFDNHTVAPNNDVLNTSWTSCYEGINRINTVLSRIEDVAFDETTKEWRRGEMYFLRGLIYFNLVRLWGEVPLVTLETTNPVGSFQIGRAGVDEVYLQIIEDLETAVMLLPEENSQKGRATSGAARTLLAKVYLTRHQYPEAARLLKEVTESGVYELAEHFHDLFEKAPGSHNEIIFEVQFKSGGIGEGSRFANLFAPIGASELIGTSGITSGDNLPTKDLYAAYKTEDVRRDATVGELADGRLYAAKYLDKPDAAYDADNDFIILRYADVLLMLAEALNELGYSPDGEAFTLINLVRKRAGLAPLTTAEVPDQDGFRRAIEKERRLELAFENHRWFDLKRTGRVLEVLNGHVASDGEVNMQPHQLYFPIPQAQLDIMNHDKLFWQNPGY